MGKRIRGKLSEEEAHSGDKAHIKHALDPYISFQSGEINMELPWDVLIDPEKNKELGKKIRDIE